MVQKPKLWFLHLSLVRNIKLVLEGRRFFHYRYFACLAMKTGTSSLNLYMKTIAVNTSVNKVIFSSFNTSLERRHLWRILALFFTLLKSVFRTSLLRSWFVETAHTFVILFTPFLQPRTLLVKIWCYFLIKLSPLLSTKDNKEMNSKHMLALSSWHFCASVLFLCFWMVNEEVKTCNQGDGHVALCRLCLINETQVKNGHLL